jgi:sec-independent protein translocase protein TatA
MGPLEIGIILVIVLIIFGVGKLPQVGDALGKGIRAFRKGQKDDDEGTVEEEAPKAEKVEEQAATPQTTEVKAEAKPETPPDKPADA